MPIELFHFNHEEIQNELYRNLGSILDDDTRRAPELTIKAGTILSRYHQRVVGNSRPRSKLTTSGGKMVEQNCSSQV